MDPDYVRYVEVAIPVSVQRGVIAAFTYSTLLYGFVVMSESGFRQSYVRIKFVKPQKLVCHGRNRKCITNSCQSLVE